MAFKDRLREARKSRKFSQAVVGDWFGITTQAVSQWEKGDSVPEMDKIARLAEGLGVTVAWLLEEVPGSLPPAPPPISNAQMGAPVALDATIKLYGQASAGRDGEFPLNGQTAATIPAPPGLRGIHDAYAVYVVGDSMEPRYFSGEIVYVNPLQPARRGNFVVAQIATGEGESPLAYVKRLVAREARTLRLEQFNPKKTLEFPASKVVSVHRIVMGGDG
jgi:phage repressor protein C with HTH and peptisase S24 domain/DNA-binding XRE family transcriptional regulator